MDKPLYFSQRNLTLIHHCLGIVADNSMLLVEELEPLRIKDPNIDYLDLEQEIRNLGDRIKQEAIGFKMGGEYFLPDMTTLTAPDENGIIKHLDHEYKEIGQRSPTDINYKEWEELFNDAN